MGGILPGAMVGAFSAWSVFSDALGTKPTFLRELVGKQVIDVGKGLVT